MAAITMSFDKDACRYAAAVQTNGSRVEMISDSNIRSMMIPLFKSWIKQVGAGNGPSHIYYFRDGVSEGQYQHVLNQEVANMKKAITAEFGAPAANVSLGIGLVLFITNTYTDQVDCNHLYQASSHPFLPQGW